MRLETFDHEKPDHASAANSRKHVMFLDVVGTMKLGVLWYDSQEKTTPFQFKVDYYDGETQDWRYAQNTVMVLLDCDTSDCLCGLCEEV